MTLQNEMQNPLAEIEFANLCSHYKDTFDIQIGTIKQRDRLFYILLLILSFFSLQIMSGDLINGAISSYVNKQVGILIDDRSNLFGTILWFLVFGVSSRYFQIILQIERQYDYLHALEHMLNSHYEGTIAFTREGKTYNTNYPLFSNWMCFLYTVAFPVLILTCIIIRINIDLNALNTLGFKLLPAFLCYLLVGTSTILYMDKLHRPTIKQWILITLKKIKELFSRKRRTKIKEYDKVNDKLEINFLKQEDGGGEN